MLWRTTRFKIDLTEPKLMGIVNTTPDSFSDGGAFHRAGAALQHAERLLSEGADILDIGGESTRPGAEPVPLALELERVLPVLREVLKWAVPVSIDTYKPEVMRAALDLGVDIVNDVWALRQGPTANQAGPCAMGVVGQHPACGVVLMHMHGEPKTMQLQPMLGDVVPTVAGFLRQRADELVRMGVDAERLVLDPGIGFGKSVRQNFSLLARQDELLELGFALLAGWSRKSSLAAVTGQTAPQQRTSASVAAALLAVQMGAKVVRVHDVGPTREALQVLQAVEDSYETEAVMLAQHPHQPRQGLH